MDLKFVLKDRVKIKELAWAGTVISIWVVERGTQYEVRYTNNSKFEKELFWEHELEIADGNTNPRIA